MAIIITIAYSNIEGYIAVMKSHSPIEKKSDKEEDFTNIDGTLENADWLRKKDIAVPVRKTPEKTTPPATDPSGK